MPLPTPRNASDIRNMVETRLAAIVAGLQETVTVEFRDRPQAIPVISMPVGLLYYNPDTHRIRAQRSTDPVREHGLESDPFGQAGQDYLHQLLMGDPKDPTQVDPRFDALKEDLSEHGQSEPGIITRSGILVNGNTRRAALKELGQENIRVGVLPSDAGIEDVRSVEMSLQLRKDHKRDYSFMNLLLAMEERVDLGHLAGKIQRDFRIREKTYNQYRWILGFVLETIERSKVDGTDGRSMALRLVDFETHQGKLEEICRAYTALKAKSSDQAEALKEQRLLALVLEKSKTDLRLIDADFSQRYMKEALPTVAPPAGPSRLIPGTAIAAAPPNQDLQALRELTTKVLRAKSVSNAAAGGAVSEVASANEFLGNIETSVVKALDLAGKQGRILKRRLAPVDRISDAREDLELAAASVAEARATSSFDPTDLDDVLVALKTTLEKLAVTVTRGPVMEGDGLAWLREVGTVAREQS